jgi:hypothetical protein
MYPGAQPMVPSTREGSSQYRTPDITREEDHFEPSSVRKAEATIDGYLQQFVVLSQSLSQGVCLEYNDDEFYTIEIVLHRMATNLFVAGRQYFSGIPLRQALLLLKHLISG